MDRSRNRPSTSFDQYTTHRSRMKQDLSFVAQHHEIAEDEFLNPDDEKKEISLQLQLIRKKHDQARQANLKRRNELEKLKHELSFADHVSGDIQETQKTAEEQMDHFENALEDSRHRYEDEFQNKKIYEHMLVRMK